MLFRDPFEAAASVLAACQRGVRWHPAALEILIQSHSPALFSHVVEPLSDAFEPAYCDAYADLFAEVLERTAGLDAAALRERYEQIRRPIRFTGNASDVCVLSRVTLGADIAVTSAFLDAAKQRFPEARIHFVGPAKNFELFNADPRIAHIPAPYVRQGALAQRIASGQAIGDLLPAGALLLDPDSRLSQLGLLPLVPAERHLFFESRSYSGDSPESLSTAAQRWIAQVLGVSASNYIQTSAPPAHVEPGMISISLGVGENAAKRVVGTFEKDLMRLLAATGRPILADLGAGGEEEARVREAIAAAALSSARISVWNGSFANFASSIAASSLYVGYDSSGQHAAAAFGIPRITVFAGFPQERFLARWRPDGLGPSRAILATNADQTLEAVQQALAELL